MNKEIWEILLELFEDLVSWNKQRHKTEAEVDNLLRHSEWETGQNAKIGLTNVAQGANTIEKNGDLYVMHP